MTYFSALSHEKVNPAPDAAVLAIVRKPQDWIDDVVDRNVPALAPPEDLLDAYKRVETAVDDDEHVDEDSSAVAWRSVNFEARFLDYLENSAQQQVLESVVETARERGVWLVCWEADDTHCHRRLVAERVRWRLHGDQQHDTNGEVAGHSLEVCPPEHHDLQPVPGAAHAMECARCGYALQSLVDDAGQDIARISR